MASMPRIVVSVLTGLALSVAIAAIGLALDFSGQAYFLAVIVAGVLISLTDRERFYGPPRSGGAGR
jgi:putative Mn2+ efflux pump MntP